MMVLRFTAPREVRLSPSWVKFSHRVEMARPTPLTAKNSSASWWAGRLRRCRNVHIRLPIQATRVAAAPEMIFDVVRWPASGP